MKDLGSVGLLRMIYWYVSVLSNGMFYMAQGIFRDTMS